MQTSGAHATETTGTGSGTTLIRRGGACAVLPAEVEGRVSVGGGVTVGVDFRIRAKVGIRANVGISANVGIRANVMVPLNPVHTLTNHSERCRLRSVTC